MSESTNLIRDLQVSDNGLIIVHHFSAFQSQVTALSQLSYVYLGKGDKGSALSVLLQAVAISNNSSQSLVYNFCLLKLKCGHVIHSTKCWLKFRGLLPANRSEARDYLNHATKLAR